MISDWGGGWSREGWKIYVSYFKKHSISMLLNKSFLFGPWPLINRPTSRSARKKNWGFRVLAGSNRKHRFAVPVRKCLHSHDCFFLKLVGGAWLPMTKFLCCYILYFVLKITTDKIPKHANQHGNIIQLYKFAKMWIIKFCKFDQIF